MKKILILYRQAYGGLSQEAWMLALVMFINRSGAMVLPFLSIYVTGPLGFSLEQAGLILGTFGLGAMAGSFLGGWLSDKIGNFRVQFFSLTAGGTLFLFIPLFTTFESLAIAVFVSSTVIECLRPANAASVAIYAKPENITRAFSLNRMALNLGFSIGPALGGLLATISYTWLFIADGFTCIAAGFFFYFYFRKKKARNPETEPTAPLAAIASSSPYKDVPFLCFIGLCGLFALVFFQFLNTLPIYYREVYALSEAHIGGLLAFNGIIVFSAEMILVYLLENRFRLWRIIVTGSLLNGLSYVLLNAASGEYILYIAMFLLSTAEILAMPFMVSFIVRRAGDAKRGAYLGLYSFSYAAAFILAPYLGTQLTARFGFSTLWWVLGIISAFTALGFYLLLPRMQPKQHEASLSVQQPAGAV
jgi:predicted MFS family arabinose efflux permease